MPDDPEYQFGKAGMVELYFDMGEPFIKIVQKDWERRKKNRDDEVRRIVTVAPADHRDVRALQAADFLAWHANRGHKEREGHQQARMYSWFAVPLTHRYWDYASLIAAALA